MTLPDTPAPKVDGRPPTVATRPAGAPGPAGGPAVPPAVERPAPVEARVAPPARVEEPVVVEPVVVEAEVDDALVEDPVVVEPEVEDALVEDPVVEEPAAQPPADVASTLPEPPCPPFEAAAPPYRWQVQLPGSVSHTFTVRVGDDRIWVDGVEVPFDAIVDVDMGIERDKATVTRRKAASAYLSLTLADGRVVGAEARDVGRSSGRVEGVVAAASYLWSVLGRIPAIRERRGVEERLRRGAEVAIGHVRLTAIGVAWKRNPIVPWSGIGDPTLRGTDLVVPTGDGDPLVIPLDVDDAFMLPSLLPELRTRFS